MLRKPQGIVAAFILLLVIAPLSLAATEPVEESTREMLRRYFEQCLNQPDDYACLEEYWPADKAQNVQQSEELRRSYFPDLRYEIVDVLVDGDGAAVYCQVTGNHPGTAPAGNAESAENPGHLEVVEAYFYRLEDGKIQSGKPLSDRLAVAQALGYTVSPPESPESQPQ